MKGSLYAAAVVLFGVNASYAGESALKSLRASVPVQVLSEAALPDIHKGYVIANDPAPGSPVQDIEWVTIPGGKFLMGIDNAYESFADAKPVHEVAIKTLKMAKTAVTVE
jgi:formylglycine-generating enzyme required for sulfatase activity